MATLSPSLKGFLITAGGVLVLSPDALLIRLIAVDSWTLAFWRGLLMSAGLMVLLAVRYRGRLLVPFRSIGRRGIGAAALFALSSVCFVSSITRTTAANTLIIVSVAPLFAAVFSRVFLGERVAPRTLAAIVVALVGMAIIFLPNLTVRSSGLVGDAIAFGTAVCMAGYLTVLRAGRTIDMIPALTLSGPIAALLVAAFAAPAAVGAADAGWLALLGLVILPLAFAGISTGPRYISAPETSLLLLLETVLGPLWVWLAVAETPSPHAFVGGAVVLATLVGHALLSLRRARAPAI